MIGLFTKCSRGWLWELALSFVFACSPISVREAMP
jgi:hypothetical protein